MNLYHAYSLLLNHGLEPFLSYLHARKDEFVTFFQCYNAIRQRSKQEMELYSSAEWRSMIATAELAHGGAGNHPKLVKLEEIVIKHFSAYQSYIIPDISRNETCKSCYDFYTVPGQCEVISYL